MAQIVETRYLPDLRASFGREWSPGIDQDSRISILHVLGSPADFELGYFSDENEYPQSLFVHSNEREMIYLNMSRLEVGSDLYLGTLLHELQHLSQWNMDPNEEVWLNEGLSQVAETMAGLDTVDPDPYLQQPGIRLDRWSHSADEVYAHYAASYLYLLYLWQRAGEAAVRELVGHPYNGLVSVQAVLAGYLPGVTLEQFTADWATATYLDANDGQGDMAYDRVNLDSPALATRARRLPFSSVNELNQFAVDYIDLDVTGPIRITFVGDTVVELVDAPPPSGGRFWFAKAGNSTEATLTTAIDLTKSADPQLIFDTWYDLEAGWDFAYLTVSVDNGQSWQTLPGQATVAGQYGPAWNGRSGSEEDDVSRWVTEAVSLAAYAGQTVLLRFDVLADFERPSRGFAVAQAHVVTEEAARQPIAWQSNGFVETGWLLPQAWGVRVVRGGASPEVFALTPDSSGLAQIDVNLGPAGGGVVVVPLTAPAADPVQYWLSVESPVAAGTATP